VISLFLLFLRDDCDVWPRDLIPFLGREVSGSEVAAAVVVLKVGNVSGLSLGSKGYAEQDDLSISTHTHMRLECTKDTQQATRRVHQWTARAHTECQRMHPRQHKSNVSGERRQCTYTHTYTYTQYTTHYTYAHTHTRLEQGVATPTKQTQLQQDAP
jgi:hypothetical protein